MKSCSPGCSETVEAVTAIVIFRFGDLRCALDRAAVAEVAPIPELSQPPGMPVTLAGFINWGGEALGVVDAARLFGVPADPDIDPFYRHVLIVDVDGAQMGMLVDRVEDVRRLEEIALLDSPADQTLNDCVVGRISFPDGDIHMLAADRILLAAEKARLADLAAIEQARLDALAVR